ncbi:MAG: MBG domain-containing protein [Bacillota bacterium]
MRRKMGERLVALLLVLTMLFPGAISAAGINRLPRVSGEVMVGMLEKSDLPEREESLAPSGELPADPSDPDQAAGQGDQQEPEEDPDSDLDDHPVEGSEEESGAPAADPQDSGENHDPDPAGALPDQQQLLAEQLLAEMAALRSESSTIIVNDIEKYWHVDQVLPFNAYQEVTAYLGESLGGLEALIRMEDASGQVVGQSDTKISGLYYGDITASWAAPAGLELGDHTLRAVVDGAVFPGWHRELEVTDKLLVVGSFWRGVARDAWVAGDAAVLIEVTVFGAEDPDELSLTLTHPVDGVPVFRQASGEWVGKTAYGASRFLYRLEAVDGYLAEPSEVLYDLVIESANQEPLLTKAYQVWTDYSGRKMWAIEVLDAATAHLSVDLQNASAGEYTARLEARDDDYNWQLLDEQVAYYSGSGRLELQFTDQGQPLCLTGDYCLTLTKDAVDHQEWFWIDNRPGALPERYEAAVLTDISTASLQAGQTVEVSGHVANLGSGLVQLELVEVDRWGRMQRVPGLQPVPMMASVAYHRLAYRFINYYQAQGSFPVPADLSEDQDYRWLITCDNLVGESRGLLSPVSMRKDETSAPAVSEMTVVGAPVSSAEQGGGHHGPPQQTSIVGLDTASFLVGLYQPQGIVDPSLVTVSLRDVNGHQVGSSVAGSWTQSSDQITLRLNTEGSLQSGDYQLSAAYDGVQFAHASVQVVEQALLEGDWFYQLDGLRCFASGSSFTLSFAAGINIDPTDLGITLRPADGGDVVELATALSRDGLRLNVECDSPVPLIGVYQLELSYAGQPAQTLDYFGIVDILPLAVCFTPSARVHQVFTEDGQYVFRGSGFTAGSTYTAMFYRAGDPLERLDEAVPLTRRSDSELILDAADLPTGWKGKSQVMVCDDDGTPLPASQELTVILQPSELPVIDPVVIVNGGAAFTFAPQVTVVVSPGTYSEMRYAGSQGALATVSYQPIVGSFDWQLGEEYGSKSLYMQFRDSSGREKLLTVSIEYLSAELPEPTGYGLSADLVCDGQPLTIWVKSSQPVQAKARLLDAAGNLLGSELTLARTGLEYGISTYSRTLTIAADQHKHVASVALSLEETATSRTWEQSLKLGYESQLFIAQRQTEIQRVYSLFSSYAKQAPISYHFVGSPGKEAVAILTYGTAEAAEHLTVIIPLAETELGSGVYEGQADLPTGATSLTRVDYQLTSDLQSRSVTEHLGLPVAASLQFIELPSVGDYHGMSLTLKPAGGWLSYQAELSGHDTMLFSDIPAGSYSYSLSDGQRVYARGDVQLTAGGTATASLAQALLPARLTINVDASEVTGYVLCEISSGNNSWNAYLPLGQTITGLAVGDQVTYEVQISHPADLTYRRPAKSAPFTIDEANETITHELEPIARVDINGRVLDELYQGAGKEKSVAGVTVYLRQELNNGGTRVYNNQSVTTDTEGRFTLSVFSDVGGTLMVSKRNFQSIERVLTAPELQGELADLQLRYLNTGYLTLDLEVAAAVPEGEEQKFMSAFDELAYIIAVCRADGSPVNGFYNHNEHKFRFDSNHGLQAGDTLTATVWAGNGLQLVEREFAVQLDAHLSADIAAQAVAPGEIQGTAKNADVHPVYTLLFDATSRYRLQMYSGSAFSTRDARLAPGEYTLVFLSGDDLQRVQRLTRLQQLEDLRLTEGEHYAMRRVTLAQGSLVELEEVEVPTVTDDDLGYLAGQGTGIAVKAKTLTDPRKPRGTVTLRYTLPERLQQLGFAVDAVEVRLLEGEGQVVNYDYYLNGLKGSTNSDFYILAYVEEADSGSGVLQFELELQGLSQSNVTANAIVTRAGGGQVLETIYQGPVDLPLLTIVCPEEVLVGSGTQVEVRGVGYIGETVEIYDNDTLVGEAITDQRGRWQTLVSLTEPDQPGTHRLQVRMQAEGQSLSAVAYTQVLPADSVRVEDVGIWQSAFSMRPDFGANPVATALSFNPSSPVYATFKLVNAAPEDVAHAGLVNEYRGTTTLYPAQYQESGPYAGYWLVDAALIQCPGVFYISYGLKVKSDPLEEAQAVARMTGTKVIDITDLPDQPELDVNTLPEPMRQAFAGSNDLSGLIDPEAPYLNGADGGDIAAKIDLGEGCYLSLSGSSSPYSGEIPEGYIRIDTLQGPYWTKAPEVTEDEANITVKYKAYFSQQLWQALSGESRPAGRMLLESQSVDGVQVLEYTSTAGGLAGDLYELKYGADKLGKWGTRLNVLGGVSLAASALLGEMGLDPAQLKAAANLITAPELSDERELILGFIDEYQNATRKSHYINTFIGGVGYVASFAGPLGKGLSYVTTVGGSIYSSSIGSEYESWGHSLISMIRSALEKQERLLTKKKKLNEENWKIDPSGYVFEATEENRIQDVTATVLVKDGDAFRIWWEAEDWAETNPQQTDEQGKYGWDVPEGEWKVRFESADYWTYETKPMQVPPLHDQVNIGLLAKGAPQVTGVVIHPDGLVLSFDRYMLPGSLTGNVLISDSDGKPIAVKEIVPVNAVENTGYTGEGDYSDLLIEAEQFAKQFKVIPDTPMGGFAQYLDDGETAVTYSVRLLPGISSYAQVPLQEAYENNALPVTERAAIAITVRAIAQSKFYGEDDPELSYEIASGALDPGDQLSGQLERELGESAGSYQIMQGTLSGGDKYDIAFETGLFTINRRPLTVTADAKQKYAGSADPALTWRVSSGSLVAGDSLSGRLEREPGESIGTYAIWQGTLAADSNYLLTFVPATLTIVARPVTPPGDNGGGGTTTPEEPETPTEPEVPENTVQLPLVGEQQTDDQGNVTGYTYTTPQTLAADISEAQGGGATQFDLYLDADDETEPTVPRSLTIASDALQAAAGTGFSLSISSRVGSVTLPQALLMALAAEGQPLALTIYRAASSGSLPAGASALDHPLAVETALRGQTRVEIPLQLALPEDEVARADYLRSLAIYAVHSDSRELIHDLAFSIDETVSPAMLTSISFQVDEFSTFTPVKFVSEPLTTVVGTPGYSIGGVSREMPACFYQGSDTFMPLRMLEEYGVSLGWDGATKTVTVAYRGKTIVLVVDSTTAVINWEEQAIIGASGRLLSPVIVGGRAMLPLRFVSEVLGFQVHWDPSHLITIRP